jgi:hypothetical protein
MYSCAPAIDFSAQTGVRRVLPGVPVPPVEPAALHKDKAAMVATLRTQIETSVFRLLMSAQASTEFESLSHDIFGQYVSLSVAISNIVRSDITPRNLDELLATSYAALGAAIAADKVLFADEESLRSDVLYGVDVLQRTISLLCQITVSLGHIDVDPRHQERDASMVWQALTTVWWAIMHLEAIVYSITKGIIPSDDVIHELAKGVGVSETAYECARESWGFRFDHTFDQISLPAEPHQESEYLAALADEEFRQILKSTESTETTQSASAQTW